MRFLIYFFILSVLSLNAAFADSYTWSKIKQKDELGQVFSLVANEAINRNIDSFDYLSMQESDNQNVVFYKFDLKSTYKDKEVDGNSVKVNPTCDVVVVKLLNKVSSLVKWNQNSCVKTLK